MFLDRNIDPCTLLIFRRHQPWLNEVGAQFIRPARGGGGGRTYTLTAGCRVFGVGVRNTIIGMNFSLKKML